jgi:glutathione synthase/RimK-type ligase-like ATP-grasp enzyme
MLAIHFRQGSFSDRWIDFCPSNNIPYIQVDMFSTNILGELRQAGVRGFLFHLPVSDLRTQLAAAQIARTVALMGIHVFPCDASYWHFDDKVAQKYLFESLDIPACRSWVFYDRESALEWASSTSYPKVFKLRCGAGSQNVKLVRSYEQATSIIRTMFTSGIRSTPRLLADHRTKIYKHHQNHDWVGFLRRLPSTLKNIMAAKQAIPLERGYVYFQQYLSGNEFDTRVTVIGTRAFAFRRSVRPNDFRASGSGRIDWDPNAIDLRCVHLAFEAARKINSQCLAFDLIYDSDHRPVVIEVCYGFVPAPIHQCVGYWTANMSFHKVHIWPQDVIIQDLLSQLDKT